MFGNRNPGTRNHERRRRRNVEGMGPIPAGAAGIQHHRILDPDLRRPRAHGQDGTGDFFYRQPIPQKLLGQRFADFVR